MFTASGHGLLVGSLRRCYQVTEPLAGFLVGFGALPTSRVEVACERLRSALLLARERRHGGPL